MSTSSQTQNVFETNGFNNVSEQEMHSLFFVGVTINNDFRTVYVESDPWNHLPRVPPWEVDSPPERPIVDDQFRDPKYVFNQWF